MFDDFLHQLINGIDDNDKIVKPVNKKWLFMQFIIKSGNSKLCLVPVSEFRILLRGLTTERTSDQHSLKQSVHHTWLNLRDRVHQKFLW